MRKKSRKKGAVSAVFSMTGTVVLVVLILICLALTMPRVFGYQIYTVISGSMEPTISIGSLVYVKDVPPENVIEGDVIAFYGGADSSSIITHRVVANSTIMGQFITKGDANEKQDINPITYENYLGMAAITIPKAGVFVQAFSSTAGKIAAASGILFVIILFVLADLLKRK